MIGKSTLSAIAFLATVSGLPGLNNVPTPPSKDYAKAKAAAVAADTLPIPWRPSWRLALESSFVRSGVKPIGEPTGPVKLQLTFDPRKLRVDVDPDSGIFHSNVEVGEVELGIGYRQPLSQFARDYSERAFHERWLKSSRDNVNSLGSATPAAHTGLSLPIPVHLPQKLSSILGPGGPALNVSGSESIRLSGTSDWTNQTLGFAGQRKSLFPSLDMQQDLDIRLEGQLSDRVKVNLLQNSANQVPLANRIAINYRGDEDDFVQALDLGNTNLSLPGTQYVSYSGKNEGLFGIKFAARVGALDFTGLASKQEGRSERATYTGGSSVTKPPPFRNTTWVRGQYFFLYDPNLGTYYDIDDNSITLYLDDGIASNDHTVKAGAAMVDPDHALGVPVNSVQDTATWRGNFDIINPGPDQQYEILKNMYSFNDTVFKVIRVKSQIPVETDQALAVTYIARPITGPNGQRGAPIQVGGRVIAAGPDSGRIVMKLLRAPRSEQISLGTGFTATFDPDGKFAPVRELELKNIYNLGGFQIDPHSFKLMVQSGQGDPPTIDLKGVPFTEMLGLDTWVETTNQPVRGQDGVVDATGFSSPPLRPWVDYDNGTLFLPDPQPFAPRAKPFDTFIAQHISRRATLSGDKGTVNAPDPDVYDLYTPPTNAGNYDFNAEFAASRSNGGDITLGRGNILDNSEAVVVNGERWVRDRDYQIDYDLGRITLKRQLGPTDQLAIDYSYAPLFAQASKTLIGSAFHLEGRDRSFGGAFLYESKGAQDIRPRLGEEPSRTVITDLNTEFRFKPSFLTRLADRLPGVRTTTPSEFNIQAEAGVSLPNPNTKNEVFIDDMEGVRDAVSLALGLDKWRWSSVPSHATQIANGTAVQTKNLLDDPTMKNAEIHWYNPVPTNGKTHDEDLVKEGDLRPKLDDQQQKQTPRTVLAISIPRKPTGFTDNVDSMWAGLTYNLDQVGLDLSRSQFIDLWVDDWRDYHVRSEGRVARVRGDGINRPSIKLHIDLGRVSEDQMRAPNRPPNGVIDSEDRTPRDNQLTRTDAVNEDTGVDGLTDAEEVANGVPRADLIRATDGDPEGDDFEQPFQNFPSAMDPRRYRGMNGTEKNGDLIPIPDTEDMNLNEHLDVNENYFEYTIDLGAQDSPYLVQDIARDFAGQPGLTTPVDTTRNGWRRYRIPIADSLRVRFGTPDLTIAQHVRVWIERMTVAEGPASSAVADDENAFQRPMLLIGGLDIVGSRWQATDLTPVQRDSLKTSLTLDAVNTVDNLGTYVAPFDPGDTRGEGNGSFKRREQSIALEFTDLFPDDTLEAFRSFSLPEDYSRYGKLRWFGTGFGVKKADLGGIPAGTYDPALDSLFYFVRFASDDKGQSYYEVKRRLSQNTADDGIAWEEVVADIAELSGAKLDPAFPIQDPILYHTVLANGDSLILRGRPSFTRLLRISIGVINHSAAKRYSGQLWFDEIRATDVAKDVGIANRVFVNGKVANLFDYNVAWNSRDANFLSVGDSRGSGSGTTSLSIATHFEPQRFFEGTGIQLPINFAQNENVTRPRFTAGDDIVRTGAAASASETRNLSRALTANYSRVWSDRSNPFLRYTLGGVAANISRTTTDGQTPTSLGTAFSKSASTSAGVSYQVALRSLGSIAMPLTKARFYPLPERFYWNYAVTQTQSSAYTQLAVNDSIVPSYGQNGRAASVNFGADARPVDLLTYHVEGQRNLALDGVHMDHLGFINFGRLTGWRQSFGSHASIGPSWARPAFGWSSNYNQTNDTQSQDLGARVISNGTDLTVNMDMPFDRLAGISSAATPPRAPAPTDSTQKKKKKPKSGPGFRPIRNLISRLGLITTDGRIGRTSTYSRVSGTASPLYLLGLEENPGFDQGKVFEQPGNTSASGIDWRGNAHTTVPLAFSASLLARGSVGDKTSNLNGVKTRSRDWRFPDFEVQYGRLANLLGLTRILDNPQLRTAYARSNQVDYQNSRSVISGTSRSDEFRPLFSLRGRFRNGTDADFRLERRSSVRESFQAGLSTATDQTTDINLTLSRAYSQGQKVNILGKSSTVKTSVNLSLTGVYSRQKGGVKIQGFDELASPVDRTRLSLNGTGSYGFSSNVTGDLSLGFSHFRETTGIVRRSVRVEMRGQFRF